MNRESKEKLLAAFDALEDMAVGRSPGPRRHSHGGSMQCDYCGGSTGAFKQHTDNCVVDHAIKALLPIVPPFADREKWLQEGDT